MYQQSIVCEHPSSIPDFCRKSLTQNFTPPRLYQACSSAKAAQAVCSQGSMFLCRSYPLSDLPESRIFSGRFQYTAYAIPGAIDVIMPQIIETGEIQFQCLTLHRFHFHAAFRYVGRKNSLMVSSKISPTCSNRSHK